MEMEGGIELEIIVFWRDSAFKHYFCIINRYRVCVGIYCALVNVKEWVLCV